MRSETKSKKNLKSFNKDGRDFARDVIKPELLKIWQKKESESKGIHILMNLPALAVEFLDVFPGLMSDINDSDIHFVAPKVHCYSFSKCDNSTNDVKCAAEHVLKIDLPDSVTRVVRNVAPKKDMVYISFELTQTLLKRDGLDAPESKRQKLSEDCGNN